VFVDQVIEHVTPRNIPHFKISFRSDNNRITDDRLCCHYAASEAILYVEVIGPDQEQRSISGDTSGEKQSSEDVGSRETVGIRKQITSVFHRRLSRAQPPRRQVVVGNMIQYPGCRF